MAKYLHLAITALRDCRVVTNVKDVPYTYSVDPNTGQPVIPEGQPKVEKMTHGINLAKDAEIEIDIREEQIPFIRAAVDAGDIEVVGLPSAPVVVPAAEAPVEQPKGKSK